MMTHDEIEETIRMSRNGVLVSPQMWQTALESALSVQVAAEALKKQCHGVADRAGWWTDLQTGESLKGKKNVGELLMLIVSEVAEGMEGHRKGLKDDKLPHRSMIEVELADALIRIFDMAGGMGYDVPGAIAEKLAYNANRQDHKPENRRAQDGKKY
jgi:NTP pyrophosphatase (non-canonical NTP hydrolase)